MKLALLMLGYAMLFLFTANDRRIVFFVAALFFSALLLSSSCEASEARFNALDQSDTHYLGYKNTLCGHTFDDIQVMQGKLDATKFFDSVDRSGWPEVYQVRVALIEQWRVDYEQFCR